MKIKILVLAFISILSASIFAKDQKIECPSAIKDYHLGIFLNSESSTIKDLTIDGPFSLKLTRRQFEKINGLKNFNYNLCKDALKELIVESKYTKYRLIFTNDDSCDGGNYYGAIFNGEKEIGQIQDQEFYCRSSK